MFDHITDSELHGFIAQLRARTRQPIGMAYRLSDARSDTRELAELEAEAIPP